MKIGVLGAGLSGVSLAFFLQDSEKISSIELLEKELEYGGLCRSFPFHGIHYDVGPHILFSKDSNILQLVLDFLGDNVRKIRRSNQIYYKERYVKYPFENDLYHLPEDDRAYCLNTFLNNPYEHYQPHNMLQFFLTTFGEGMTNVYLRPYNEKIWKFDPAFMDTQMVERIPKPPREDVIKSAEGVSTEGYTHQLYFNYPRSGGVASLVDSFAVRHSDKVDIQLGFDVTKVERDGGQWHVTSTKGETKTYDRLISTIPIPHLAESVGSLLPEEVHNKAASLKSNAIIITVLKLKEDRIGDHFALNFPDSDLIFHRVTKLDFLYERHHADDKSIAVMVEVTYRKGDIRDEMSDETVLKRILADFQKIGFIGSPDDCLDSEIKRFAYAYVIYDLHHRPNVDMIKHYFQNVLGIWLVGRFGEYEYVNTDQVVKRTLTKSRNIKEQL